MPRKIVIDTDPGVDDVLAILLALASPEVEVALISLVFGNTHAPQTFANVLKVYHNLLKERDANPAAKERYPLATKPVVAIGEDGPIGGDKHVATYFHGRDGLSNITETNPEFTPPEGGSYPLVESKKRAYEAMLELLAAEPEGTVTIIALGPLTNLAWAYREDPATFSRVGEVVWMGGALDVPGNTSPTAEFNSFADPYAFDLMLQGAKAGAFSFIFAPLDITSKHTIPFPDLLHPSLADVGREASAPPTPLEAFVTAFLLRVRGLQANFGLPDAMEMHDPVAIWYAIENAPRQVGDGWAIAGREFGVERQGELTRGMCVVDRRGTGESEGTIRTENETLLQTAIPHHIDKSAPMPNPATTEEAARIGFPSEDAKPAPNGSLQDTGLNGQAATKLESPTKKDALATQQDKKLDNVNLSTGTAGDAAKYLPKAIASTPGNAALRAKVLSRVFGRS